MKPQQTNINGPLPAASVLEGDVVVEASSTKTYSRYHLL